MHNNPVNNSIFLLGALACKSSIDLKYKRIRMSFQASKLDFANAIRDCFGGSITKNISSTSIIYTVEINAKKDFDNLKKFIKKNRNKLPIQLTSDLEYLLEKGVRI